MEKTIEIKPLYHEWGLITDEKVIYSFGDVTEILDYYDNKNEFIDDVYNMLIDEANDRFNSYNENELYDFMNNLTSDEIIKLKSGIGYMYYYYK